MTRMWPRVSRKLRWRKCDLGLLVHLEFYVECSVIPASHTVSKIGVKSQQAFDYLVIVYRGRINA